MWNADRINVPRLFIYTTCNTATNILGMLSMNNSDTEKFQFNDTFTLNSCHFALTQKLSKFETCAKLRCDCR